MTLTFDPKMDRGHLLVMTALQEKYEDYVICGFQDNQQKPSGLPTDRPTLAKQYTPSSLNGGIIIYSEEMDCLWHC